MIKDCLKIFVNNPLIMIRNDVKSVKKKEGTNKDNQLKRLYIYQLNITADNGFRASPLFVKWQREGIKQVISWQITKTEAWI